MSIRLRFTLLYTLILAVTLTLFGVALYTIQAQDTLRSLYKLDRPSAAVSTPTNRRCAVSRSIRHDVRHVTAQILQEC